MKKVKAALLGLDNPHSVAHLRTLQQLPEVESILIWSEREELNASLDEASREKVERVDTNLTSVLTDDDIHFVITCLRNDQSADVCIRALEAGKHVIAEKPIGLSAAEVQRVVQTAEALGLKLGVFYGRRYIPLVCQVKEIVEQGILGTLISAELRMLTTQVRFRDPDYWLFKKKHSGGGMLAWLGCHYVDMVRHVTGEEIVSVSAEVATRNGEDIDVEDVAVLSFRLASGAVGVMHVGYVMALSGGGYHNIGGYDTYVGLNGQRGRLHWSSDGTPTQLRVESDHPEWSAAPKRQFDFTLSSSPAYGGVHGETFVQDFLRATWGEGDVPASGKDALQVARVVEAAYESSESGRRVQIPTD
jgi:predicted dehydrogenase